MHGLGNDYIYINCLDQKINNPSKLSKILSNRHTGIGSDGLILILPSDSADFRMRMFNSDGSEAEMCGNAIRCVGKFVYDNKLTDKLNLEIETKAGIKYLEMTKAFDKISLIKVGMGEPILKSKDIPVNSKSDMFIGETVVVDNKNFKMTCVSMGNPHAIVYVDDVMNFPLHEIGPKIENHSLFPNRINFEIVQVINRSNLKIRVWERGAGETLACGTGACAVLVASVLNGRSERKAMVNLLGGDLIIDWDDIHVYMTGPAVKVFEGEFDLGMIKE